MDRNLTLYQLSPELAAKVFDRIESFNRGRMPKDGKYVISMPTLYRPYYGFWRIFSDDKTPTIRTYTCCNIRRSSRTSLRLTPKSVIYLLTYKTTAFLKVTTDNQTTLFHLASIVANV